MTEVVTGEAVILDVPVARFPSRIAAVLIDLLVQLLLFAAVVIVILANSGHLDGGSIAGILVGSYVVIVVGYATIFETLTRGKTLGKMALGLRVISDDGAPIRFRQALIRALAGSVEVWSQLGAPIGLITSILSAKGKRLGDMFAGTYVIQERTPRRPELAPMFATVPPPLLGWAQVAEISRLSDHNAEAASSYLRRLYELNPAARNDLGLRLAAAIAAQVSPPPPPGTPPWAYLAAVLAVRREREFARLASQPGLPGPGGAPTAAFPAAAPYQPPAPYPPSAPYPPPSGHPAPSSYPLPDPYPPCGTNPAPAETAAADPAAADTAEAAPGAPGAAAPNQPIQTGFAPPA